MEDSLMRNWGISFAAGAIGAVTLTAIHQLATKVTDDAPRMDVLGERAIVKGAVAAGRTPPQYPSLYLWALAGDLLANSAYYSLITCGRNARTWLRAVSLGVGAGVGALVLPRRIGLGDPPRSWKVSNQVMTVAWYLLGALAAAAAGRQLSADRAHVSA
ncbi:MAG TPA: hypothetical protein VEL51_05210 [Vicinamibacterales bacterium]|nr:hypothetical protein [Vicinamibacterales bacterium]